MKHVLISHTDKCIGCGTCELACSLQQTDMFRPSASNMRVYRVDETGDNYAVACLQCQDAPCMQACKFGALTRNAVTDVVETIKEKCVGCTMCVRACPFKSIAVDKAVKKSFKCNQCEGDPQCVKQCPAKALEFLPADDATNKTHNAFADKMRQFFTEVK